MGSFPPPAGRASRGLVGVALVAWGGAVAGIYGYERMALRADQNTVTSNTRPDDPLFRFAIAGIDRPPTVEAGASTIRPDEEVIGVEVAGRARAYRLAAFRDRSHHVVNDLIGSVPVTVTYCDIGDCVRAYTDPRSAGPLGVSVAGLYNGREMVLGLGGSAYLQESGTPLTPGAGPTVIPLERIAPTRTSWAAWRRLHPATDVYEGDPR